MSGNIAKYPEDYIENAFFEWYKAGRSYQIADRLPEYDGVKPTTMTLGAWRRKYDWDARADEMDAEVAARLEKEAIEQRAEAIKKLAQAGGEMVDMGLKYIKENGFDTASAAVRAVLGGADMVSKFVGMGEFVLGISRMNDAQLTREFYRLLGKATDETVGEGVGDGNVIDASVSQEENTDESSDESPDNERV